MAENLTNDAEVRVLNWLTGNPSTAPVLPLRVALVTVNGDDATAGTEVVGSVYARQDAAFTVTDIATNSALISWTSLDATNSITVVGLEIWDSASPAVRWWHGALITSKTVTPGDPCEIAPGDLDLSLG